jgi:hypothetical protein
MKPNFFTPWETARGIQRIFECGVFSIGHVVIKTLPRLVVLMEITGTVRIMIFDLPSLGYRFV